MRKKNQPSINPELHKRLKLVAANRKPARRIPMPIIHKAIDESKGILANVFRILYFRYGYTENEIKHALAVKAQAHVWNAVHWDSDTPDKWTDMQRARLKDPKAIEQEIAKAFEEEEKGGES